MVLHQQQKQSHKHLFLHLELVVRILQHLHQFPLDNSQLGPSLVPPLHLVNPPPLLAVCLDNQPLLRFLLLLDNPLLLHLEAPVDSPSQQDLKQPLDLDKPPNLQLGLDKAPVALVLDSSPPHNLLSTLDNRIQPLKPHQHLDKQLLSHHLHLDNNLQHNKLILYSVLVSRQPHQLLDRQQVHQGLQSQQAHHLLHQQMELAVILDLILVWLLL